MAIADGSRTNKPRLTLSVIASGVAILGAITATGRYVLTPWFVTVASDALADDMRQIARSEVSGVKSGVEALLQDKIDELDARRTVLEATQQRNPSAFTDAMAVELASIRARLEKQRMALSAAQAQAASRRGVK